MIYFGAINTVENKITKDVMQKERSKLFLFIEVNNSYLIYRLIGIYLLIKNIIAIVIVSTYNYI